MAGRNASVPAGTQVG